MDLRHRRYTEKRLVKTKIVATVGPACAKREQLHELVLSGVDVFRLNFAHGKHDWLSGVLASIRAISEELKRPIGVLGDLSGPKIRLGPLPEEGLCCQEGGRFQFVREADPDDLTKLTSTYDQLIDDLEEGDRVLLADGTVAMRVVEVAADLQSVTCVVEQQGLIRTRQGINLPGVQLSTPSLTEKDHADLKWAVENELDFVGLSFVRSAQDIRDVKSAIEKIGTEFPPQVIAKIEKMEAVSDLDAILDVTDAVMVARGDLGVEVDIARVPPLQKQIVDLCNRHRIPVITATQMLDSMQTNELPTRAEASDVANAILDGSDAVMLSGETAIGHHPAKAVAMMSRIATEAERLVKKSKLGDGESHPDSRAKLVTEAVTLGASTAAEHLKADLIVVATHSGRTAMAVSKQRSPVPILALTDRPDTARRMTLYWGVTALETTIVDESPEQLIRHVVEWGRKENAIGSGNRIVVVASTSWSAAGHDLMIVHAAKIADKFSLVRSLNHDVGIHSDGGIIVLTGKRPSKLDPTSQSKSEHPDFGSITSRVRGMGAHAIPPYVAIPRQPYMTRPTYLGLHHKAFEVSDPSAKTYKPPQIQLSAGRDGRALNDRRALLKQFDRLRADIDLTGSMQGTEEFRDLAFQLLTSPQAARAFDISRESDKLRDRYGRHQWGQGCLLARRLAEAGTGVISLYINTPKTGQEFTNWDDHILNAGRPGHFAKYMRVRLPYMDEALTTLIEDIYERGLDQKIMVVVVGEFGRTPRLSQNNNGAGRNHWPQAYTALVSGGGLKMGQVGDDMGMAGLSELSFYHAYIFPRTAESTFRRAVLLDGLSPAAIRKWQGTYRRFLGKVAEATQREQIISRNATNTGRIPQLLEVFPDARFIHVYRNPYHVFAGTCERMHNLAGLWSLQTWDPSRVREQTLTFYEQVMRRYFATKDEIPAENLVEIRYEDFEQNQLETMETVYRALRLGDYSDVRERALAYLESNRGEPAGQKLPGAADIAEINRCWGFAIDRLGYERVESVYVRELMQNSVDAIVARQQLDPMHQGSVAFEVSEAADSGPATLVVHDNGIGLTEEEVHRFLATIGQSSKRESFSRDDFIGQFGIGLLSGFLVSSEIVVITKSVQSESPAVKWTGRADGTYAIEVLDGDFSPGTQVFLQSRDDSTDYFRADFVRKTAGHFGSLLPIPLTVSAGGRAETINTDPPWRLPHADAEAERKANLEYGRSVFGMQFFDAIPLKSETGGIEGLAFVLPTSASLASKRTHRVYLKNMLLSESAEGVLPEWAFFVRCIFDAKELKPTASRESFHEDETLDAARNALGQCLRDYLIEVARTDRDRLNRLIGLHYIAIKALALEDDEFYRMFIDWLPFETSLGQMTLADVLMHETTIRYVPTRDQFRQIAGVASAQGMCIVNAGYAFDTELIERLDEVMPDRRVQRVDSSDLTQQFEELSLDEREEIFDFLKLVDITLQPFQCAGDVKRFQPQDLPTLLTTNEEANFLRSVDQSKDVADAMWSGVLDNLSEETMHSAYAELCLNYGNPLIERLSRLHNRDVVRRAIELLYVQALLMGHFPLRAREMKILPGRPWPERRKEIKRRWLELMGPFPTKVPKLKPVMKQVAQKDGITRFHVSFQSEADDRVTAWLLVPDAARKKPTPAIICIHSTTWGSAKDQVTGLSGRRPVDPPRDPQVGAAYGLTLARHGFVTLSIDLLTDGERIAPNRRVMDTRPFYLKHPEWSIVGKNTWDIMRSVDFLQTLDFVDHKQIGCTGWSLGGHTALFAAAFDERITATVSNGGVLDWYRHASAWSRKPSTWTPWRKGIDPPTSSKKLEKRFGFKTNSGPYIYLKKFRPYIEDPSMRVPVDFDSLMALVAPRPLLIISTEQEFHRHKFFPKARNTLDVFIRWRDTAGLPSVLKARQERLGYAETLKYYETQHGMKASKIERDFQQLGAGDCFSWFSFPGGHAFPGATWDENLLLFLERQGFPEETYHTFSYSPLPDDDGGVGGMLCVVTEETERNIGERRLRTLRELAARTMDEARSAGEACRTAEEILKTNPQDIPFSLLYLLGANGRQAQLTGITGLERDASTSPAVVDLNEDDSPWPLRQVAEQKQIVEVENVADILGGKSVGVWPESPHRALVLPLGKPGQTQLAGFLIVGISPRRPLDDGYRGFFDLLAGQLVTAIANARAYEEERRRAESLAELDRAKTAFFSNVSHEFRTPLTLMLGPVEDMLSRSYSELSPSVKNQLDVVNRNGLRLLRLVNSLLDFSRIEAGRVRAAFQPTDLAAYTAELASVFRSAVERAGLAFQVDCPSLSEPVFVDRDMWEKIVLNLLSNAFKFTFEGKISIELQQVDGGVELRVRDTGTGIAPDQIPRLFERFHRIENARGRTHEGSGIGLALVEELVKLHRGSIAAESELDRGTTFTVTLPFGSDHLPPDQVGTQRSLPSTTTGAMPYVEEALRWLPDEMQEEEAIPPEVPPAEEPAAGTIASDAFSDDRPVVLVADDNADMRQYVVRLLAENYQVIAVADGEAALNAARRQHPDLILSDIMMPRMDGFELLGELRKDRQIADIPVIMLSARAGEESRVEGMTAGADDYLVKPFSARELLARVGAHLQMARQRKEAMEAVQQGEERLRMAMSAARMLVWEWDPHADNVVLSENAAEILGLPPGTTLEKSEEAFALVHKDDVDRVRSVIEQAVSQSGAFQIEFRMVRPDNGETIWFEERGHAVRDESGATALLVGVATDVTDRKRAEIALEQREAHLRAIVESTPECIKIVDAEGTLLQMNPAGLQMVEAEPNTVNTGACVYDFIAPEFRDEFRAFNQRVCAGEPDVLQFDLIGRKGTRRHLESHAVPLPGSNGEFTQLALTRDITNRKQAETALRKERDLLRVTLASIGDAVITTDTNAHITNMNGVAETLTGWSIDDAIGKPLETIFRIVNEDTRETVENPAVKALREGAIVGLANHTILIGKDGRNTPIDDSAAPIQGDDGVLIGCVLVFRDVTERRQHELALRESEAHFRTIADNVPAMLWMTHPDSSCSFLSRGWFEHTGQSQEEGLGHGWLNVVHPDDRERVGRIFEEANRNRTSFAFDYRLRCADGSYRWAIDSGRPRIDHDGKFLGFIGSVIDVHERKKAEEFRSGQAGILEMITSEEPLETILTALVDFIERQIPAAIGSILLCSPDTKRLLHGAAPRLPQAYNDAIHGVEIGPGVGSCGTAAFRGESVIVEDIEIDPLWKDYKHLAEECGLRACWSQPIHSADGSLLGTFAIYFSEPRSPRADEIRILKETARFAGIAIDRPRAQKALRESEERFRAFTNATSDTVYRMSADWSEMRQLDGRQFIADTLEPTREWLDTYIHPGDQSLVLSKVHEAIAGKSVFELEHRVRRVDGTMGWTLSRAIPMLDDDGEIVEWFGAASDVTPRKIAEEAQRRIAATFAALIEKSPLGIYVVDSQFRVSIVSEGAAPAFRNVQPVIGRDFGDVMHTIWPESFANEAIHIFRHTLETGETYVSPGLTEKRRDIGAIESYEWQVNRVMLADGRFGVVCYFFDTTRLQQALRALRDSEERFRMLADNMSQLAWTCEELGDINWYNQRWLDYTGCDLEEMLHWGWKAVQHPDHIDRVVESVIRSRESGKVWEDTFPLRGKDGEYRWFLSRAVPIRNEQGEIVRWFGTNTDITEQLRTQEELRDLADRLSETDRRKDEFLATLAHELRNPLAPIRTGLEAIRLSNNDFETIAEVRETMERQTQQLITLVDDLLDVSRITRGKLELRKCRIELAEIVRNAVEASQPFIDESDHELSLSLPDEPVELNADPHRLSQVLSNLLNNSAKYTPDGGHIRLAAERETDAILITVSDNGIGIPAEKLDSIFEMFTQVVAASDGVEAFELLKTFRPDIILSDVEIPGMNGLQFARELRQRDEFANLFLVAVTGSGLPDDRQKTREAGFDEHVTKPPSVDQMAELLAHPRCEGGSPELAPATDTGDAGPLNSEPEADSAIVLNSSQVNDLRTIKHDIRNTAYLLQMSLQLLSSGESSPEVIEEIKNGLEQEVQSLQQIIELLQGIVDDAG
eukprot:g8371.t1